ncbi:MAG: HAD family hydrolase [Verrucomicrobiota bacterium]|nr:HAD family hydrolase [Verrucomicrobiota bacterium]
MLHTAKPAVFLDRDGTLIEEAHYCRDPALVRIFPGVPQALGQLKEAGFQNVIITNQSGIGRGLFSEDEFQAVQARVLELLGAGKIDATYFCADAPENPSRRRKPSPEMVLEAARDLGLDLAHSWLIGDKALDVQCALNAGVSPILVQTGYGKEQSAAGAVFIAGDLLAAVDFILRNADGR